MYMKEEIEELLSLLCVEYGFCLQGDFFQAISERKRYSAEEFVQDIFLADGTRIDDKKLYAPIFEDLFRRTFGKRVFFWNRRFLFMKKSRCLLKESNVPILMEYARVERFIKIDIKKLSRKQLYYGKIKLRKRARII